MPDSTDAKPLLFIVSADKSKLSTFGTQKGYAVVAKVGNIPVAIRNGICFGGSQIVGLNPVVCSIFNFFCNYYTDDFRYKMIHKRIASRRSLTSRTLYGMPLCINYWNLWYFLRRWGVGRFAGTELLVGFGQEL